MSVQSPTAILFLQDKLQFYLSTYAYAFRVLSFLQVSHHTPVFLVSFTHATCLTHPIFIDLIIVMFNNKYKSWRSWLFSFLQPPLTSSSLVSWISLSTLFLNTHSLCSSLNVTDQVSHLYKTTGKTTESNLGNYNYLHHIGHYILFKTF